jgi:hypothetical protein
MRKLPSSASFPWSPTPLLRKSPIPICQLLTGRSDLRMKVGNVKLISMIAAPAVGHYVELYIMAIM